MSGSTGRYDYLDGIRAVAILAVLSLHWLSWYTPFLHGGSIGVDLFFVLSGFIITTVLWRADLSGGGAWWSFIRRRVVRLYPALLGLVAGTMVIYAVVPGAPDSLTQLLHRGVIAVSQDSAVWAAAQHGNLFLPSLQPFGQTWSLAVEWYFYLLWPVAVFVARRRGWRARRLSVVALVSAAVLYAVALPLGTFVFYFGPAARFAELLVGGALALWLRERPSDATAPRSLNATAAVALVAVAAYTLLAPSATSVAYRAVGLPLAVLAGVVLIVAGYAAPTGPVQRLLGHRWLAGIGRASYSLYLWHLVPLLLLQDALPRVPMAVTGLIVVAATAVLTAASYALLERPFLKPRSDLLTPSSSTPRTASSSRRPSAAALLRLRPMRVAAIARSAAPEAPAESSSAKNAPNLG